MKTILFQGDSITDAGRGNGLGTGYPLLVTADLGYKHPNDYKFVNRGISGNRIVDLYARIKSDIININPDYLSILIGVNDVWHEILYNNGVGAEKFEKIYSMLIDEIKEALPDTQIMILEPFVLKGSATEDTEEIPNRWELFKSEVGKLAQKARSIADSKGLKFVPLQEKFDEAVKLADEKYWLADGVHPTAMGHELIKQEWLTAFETIKHLKEHSLKEI